MPSIFQRLQQSVGAKSRSVVDMTNMFAQATASATMRFAKMLETGLPGQFALDPAREVETGGRKVAMLKNGERDTRRPRLFLRARRQAGQGFRPHAGPSVAAGAEHAGHQVG